MNKDDSRLSPAWKLLIGSAAGVGIGFGTCGISAFLGRLNGPEKIFITLGLVIFCVSLLSFAISLLWLIVEFVIGIFRRG